MENSIRNLVPQATGRLQMDRPESGASSVFMENFANFERLGATYTHKLYKGSSQYGQGYSKPANQAEPADKEKLLKDIISRLARSPKGYLRKGNSISFYQNFSDFNTDSVKLFTLYAERWIPEPFMFNGWVWLHQFLNHFYTPSATKYVQDLSGNTPRASTQAPPPSPAPPKNGQATFNFNKRFTDPQELFAYCRQLTVDGHADGRVSDYQWKMIEKHGWDKS